MEHTTENKSLVINTFLTLLSFVWLFPFVFVVINSLKSSIEYNTGNFWDLPSDISVAANFEFITSRIDFLASFSNTFIYGLVAAFFAIVFAILAAYAISVLDIKGKLFWFLLIYSGTVFPFQMYLIPTFQLYQLTGLYDTKVGLLAVYTAMCIPFCLFVLRNYFFSFPKELVESARMDGASDLKILTRIYVPMAKAPIAALFLFQFTWVWNDLVFGMTLSTSSSVRPIMSALSMLNSPQGTNDVPAVLLAAFIASIPTVVIFLILNKSFEKGFLITTK